MAIQHYTILTVLSSDVAVVKNRYTHNAQTLSTKKLAINHRYSHISFLNPMPAMRNENY